MPSDGRSCCDFLRLLGDRVTNPGAFLLERIPRQQQDAVCLEMLKLSSFHRHRQPLAA
ncbi:MAG: hypothetical protein ABFD97_19275 [Syntrophobacter sp.]